MCKQLKNSPLLATLLFVSALFCALMYLQVGGVAQPAACGAAENFHSLVNRACGPCCATMPCCLLSERAPHAPSRPEPLSPENNRHLDHAANAVAFTLLPSFFDFAGTAPARRLPSACRIAHRAPIHAPRAAVSCIWLI